jgi:lipid-binding SYLF domain-containing protein
MHRIISAFLALSLAGFASFTLAGCSTAPKSEAKRESLISDAEATIVVFKRTDPGIGEFFDNAYGYAVFPSVGKGAVGIGGAYGRGVLYEQGALVGFCDLSQGSIGFQLGGQSYSEAIFFQTPSALRRFKAGNFAFAAQASAVALTAGASADAAYENGVAVFTRPRGGAMFEASIGGQNFTFEPM